MDWDAIGAVGELIGATAVIATLAYLSIQIRQNSRSINQQTNMAVAQIHQQRADSVSQLAELVTGSPENSGLMAKLLTEQNVSLDDFTASERVRIGYMLSALRAHLENIYLQHKRGYLEDDFYRDVAIPLFASTGGLFITHGFPLSRGFKEELIRVLDSDVDVVPIFDM